MSAGEIRGIAERLGELSRRLADPELSGEQAEGLAREAAELAARGGGLVEAALRDLAQHPAGDRGEEVEGAPPAGHAPDG